MMHPFAFAAPDPSTSPSHFFLSTVNHEGALIITVEAYTLRRSEEDELPKFGYVRPRSATIDCRRGPEDR